jgi:PH (Pleckstrin Homology) domain-containing protein
MKGDGMSIEQTRANITGRIWQSIAQSGVDISAIPRDQLEKMVGTIADGVLLTVNELLDDAGAPPPATGESAQQTGAEEQTLWEGRPFLSLGEHYLVTSERVRITKGLFGKDREDIELFRIKDIDHTQHLTERMFNIGDITLRSGDRSDPEVILRNVANPEQVHEIIRRAMLEARQRHRVGFRDEM